MKTGNGYQYLLKDGTPLKQSFKTVAGKTYYFGKTGRSLRYSQWINDKLYYFKSDYTMHTGWVTWNSDKTKSYFSPSNGAALKGWAKISGKRYYFNSKRKALKGNWKIDGKFYYFKSTCVQHTGWLTWKDGRKSYYNPKRNGAAAIGWWNLSGKRYYFSPQNGKFVRYKQKIGGNTYYFNKQGAMFRGWLKWSGQKKWSYFANNGVMAEGSATVNGIRYSFDSQGKTSTRPKAGRVFLLNALDSASNSSTITVFGNTNYSLNSTSGKKLKKAVNSIRNSGYSLGFVMMDLSTGTGVCSLPNRKYYVASSIKGPYVAAANKYAPKKVTSYWKSVMKDTISWSSNSGYAACRGKFGSSVMSKYMSYADVSGNWPAAKSYTYMNTRSLSKLWVANYFYFYRDTNANSKWCRSIFTDSWNSPIHDALYTKYKVHSKPGWYPLSPYWVQNDGGIVMVDGKPYLIAIMSSACGEYGKLRTLCRALDSVHTSMASSW